eukprot:1142580-Pelagomonas_calceolata.AAC.3
MPHLCITGSISPQCNMALWQHGIWEAFHPFTTWCCSNKAYGRCYLVGCESQTPHLSIADNAWKTRGRDVKEGQEGLMPLAGVQVHEHCARRIGHCHVHKGKQPCLLVPLAGGTGDA